MPLNYKISVDPRVYEFAQWWMEQNRDAVAPRDFEATVASLAKDIQSVCEEAVDEDYKDINARSLARFHEKYYQPSSLSPVKE